MLWNYSCPWHAILGFNQYFHDVPTQLRMIIPWRGIRSSWSFETTCHRIDALPSCDVHKNVGSHSHGIFTTSYSIASNQQTHACSYCGSGSEGNRLFGLCCELNRPTQVVPHNYPESMHPISNHISKHVLDSLLWCSRLDASLSPTNIWTTLSQLSFCINSIFWGVSFFPSLQSQASCWLCEHMADELTVTWSV